MRLDVGQQVERYTIEALIGEGGQGRVYLVRHTQLGTEHALKIVLNASGSVRERLLREGRAQARLVHPNIVHVTDVIDVDNQPGLVMQFVRGPTLDDLIHGEDLTIGQIDHLARGILAGMHHAHRARFIHRDLKPLNVMCEVSGGGLTPKIADFGLVKALGEEGKGLRQTRTGVMMGSAHYMSPEQIRSTRSVDERSDVWSLGAMLYQTLTGQLPFDGGEDMFETFAAVTRGEYMPIKELRPDAPDRMCRAIEAALVVDAEERTGSVGALKALWCGEIETIASYSESELSGQWDISTLSRLKSESMHSQTSGASEDWPVGTLSTERAESAPPAASEAASDDAPPARTSSSLTVPGDQRSMGIALIALALVLAVLGVGAAVLALGLGAAMSDDEQRDGAVPSVSDTPARDIGVPPAEVADATAEEGAELSVGPGAEVIADGVAGEEEGGDGAEDAAPPDALATAPAPVAAPAPFSAPAPVAVAPAPPPAPVVAPKPSPVTPAVGTLTVSRAGLSAEDQFFLANARGQVLKSGDEVSAGTWKVQYRRGSRTEMLDSPVITLEDGQSVTLFCSNMPRCRHTVK